MTWPVVRRALDYGVGRPRARHLLRLGPWTWPAESSELFEGAKALAEVDGPQAPGVGTALMVTVDGAGKATGTRGSLWRVHAADRLDGDVVLASADDKAREAVAMARDAVLPNLPVLWEAADVRGLPVIRLEWLVTVELETGRAVERSAEVTGPSLGAAAALAQASRLLGVPVNAAVVASAEVTRDGELRPVDGLAEKARLVERLLPGVRLVTAPREGLPAGVETVGTLRALFAQAFPPLEALVADRLARIGAVDVLRELETTILERQHCGLGWSPFRDTAREAAKLLRGEEGLADTVALFEVLGHVADRHLGGRETFSAVPWAAVEGLPKGRRARYLAHLAQHSADTGSPAVPELDRCQQMLDRLPREDWDQRHRALAGALSRARSVTGRLADELRVQEALAQQTLEDGETGEVSFPLSAWFRLAGACGDAASFERALALRGRLHGGVSDDGVRFMDQAQAYAAALLGRPEDIPPGAVDGRHGKTQLRTGARRLAVLAALARGEDTAAVLAGQIREHVLFAGTQGVDLRDVQVSLRNVLLAIVDLLAAGSPQPAEVAEVPGAVAHVLDRRAREAGARDGAGGTGPDSALPHGSAEHFGLGEWLGLFLHVEAEPMRRVRATEEAVGHATEQALADAIRRRYPY